jgi:hypothetical protein
MACKPAQRCILYSGWRDSESLQNSGGSEDGEPVLVAGGIPRFRQVGVLGRVTHLGHCGWSQYLPQEPTGTAC